MPHHAAQPAQLRAVLAEGPAIIYNVPGRTGAYIMACGACQRVPWLSKLDHMDKFSAPFWYAGQDIPDDLILTLAQHENFLGVKECTGALVVISLAQQFAHRHCLRR